MRRISANLLMVLVLGVALWPQAAVAQIQRGPRFLLASNDHPDPVVRVDVKASPILRQNVSLAFDNVTIKEALAEISRRTGLDLIYADDVVPVASRVSLRAEGITTAAALTHVLTDAGVDVVFTTSGRAMLVRQPPLEPIPAVGAVTGIVMRAGYNEPIPSAEVTVEGTRHHALTDRAGRFRIEGVPAGSHTVRASALGYRGTAQVVDIHDGDVVTLEFALLVSALPLDAVVVTGTVLETAVRELPTPITVVDAETIERLGMQNVPEILRMTVPGLVFTTEGGPTATFGNFSVRGVSNANNGTTLKVYVDGVEFANTVSLTNIDPASIERIEVLRGPQASTIYGSQALSGVIQIFTKKGSRTGLLPRLSGRTAFKTVESPYVGGTPTGHRFDLGASGGNARFRYNLGANAESEPEWLELYQKEQENLFGNAEFNLGRLSVGGTAQFKQGHWESYWNPISRMIDREVGRPSTPPNSSSDDYFQQYGMDVKFAPTPRWQHNLRGGYSIYGSESSPLRPNAEGLYDLFRFAFHRRTMAYNTTLRLPLSEAFASTLTLGADHSRYVTRSAFFQVADKADYEEPEETESDPRVNSGFFGQAQLGFRDFLFLTGGLRGDRNPEGSARETTWSPRVGLSAVRDLGDFSAKARVAYGQAIILPLESQITGSENEFQVTLPNPELRAQLQRGYDLGVDLYYRDRASLSVTYFDQEPIDLIALLVDGQDDQGRFIFQYQNVERVSNKGWEITTQVSPLRSLTLQLVYGGVDSRVVQLSPGYTGDLEVGGKIGIRPAYTASGSVIFTPFEGTSLTASGYRYGSWRYTDWLTRNRDFAAGDRSKPFSSYAMDYPAFTKFNVGVSQTLSETVSAWLQIHNAGNSDAAEFSNTSVRTPRTITIGLRYSGR